MPVFWQSNKAHQQTVHLLTLSSLWRARAALHVVRIANSVPQDANATAPHT
jgi:hypothetical protein